MSRPTALGSCIASSCIGHHAAFRSDLYKQQCAGCLRGSESHLLSRLAAKHVLAGSLYTHTHTHLLPLTALHGIRAIPLAVAAVCAGLLSQYFTNTVTLISCYTAILQQRRSRLRLLPGTLWIWLSCFCCCWTEPEKVWWYWNSVYLFTKEPSWARYRRTQAQVSDDHWYRS